MSCRKTWSPQTLWTSKLGLHGTPRCDLLLIVVIWTATSCWGIGVFRFYPGLQVLNVKLDIQQRWRVGGGRYPEEEDYHQGHIHKKAKSPISNDPLNIIHGPTKKKKKFTPLLQFYGGLCTLRSPLVAKLGPQNGILSLLMVWQEWQVSPTISQAAPQKSRSRWTGVFTRRWPGRWVALRVYIYGSTSIWLLNSWDRSRTWRWSGDTWTLPEPRLSGMDDVIPGNLSLPTEWSPFSWRKAHSQILNLNLGVTPGSKKKWSWKLYVSRN